MLTIKQLDAIDEASAHRHSIHNGSGLTLDRGTMEPILSLARRTLAAEAECGRLREQIRGMIDAAREVAGKIRAMGEGEK